MRIIEKSDFMAQAIGIRPRLDPPPRARCRISYILGEHEPICRTIQVNDERFFVSFPYITYMLREVDFGVDDIVERPGVRKFYISFSQTSTTELTHVLRWTGLPNVLDNGEVCLGCHLIPDNDDLGFGSPFNIGGEFNLATFNKVVGYFWMSSFTTDPLDLEWHGTKMLRRHFNLYDSCPYQAWADASEKDPNYGLKIEWPKLSDDFEVALSWESCVKN